MLFCLPEPVKIAQKHPLFTKLLTSLQFKKSETV